VRIAALSVVVGAALACSSAARAERFRDEAHGVSFDLPAGYVDLPLDERNVIHAWARGEMDDYAQLRLEDLGGTIGRDGVDPAIVEKAARESAPKLGVEVSRVDVAKTRWRSFDLDLVTTRAVASGQPVVFIAVQVPLAPKAVQLRFVSRGPNEARLRGEVELILATLDGRSNWLTDGERSERLGRVVGSILGGGIVIAVMIAVRRRRRRRAAA